MKVVFLKNNNFIKYYLSNLEGYNFNPRNKNINYLNIVDKNIINFVLSKKIKREISKAKKAIELMINNDITIKSDCDIMLDELYKITKKLDIKYRHYFDEFVYYERVKELYILYHLISYKKKIISE